MTLKREFYRALEDVVGPENISDDPVILYSYTMPVLGMGKVMDEEAEGEHSAVATDEAPMYEAVTFPKDTKEVQAIVKLCNKYKMQFKASSTGQP